VCTVQDAPSHHRGTPEPDGSAYQPGGIGGAAAPMVGGRDCVGSPGPVVMSTPKLSPRPEAHDDNSGIRQTGRPGHMDEKCGRASRQMGWPTSDCGRRCSLAAVQPQTMETIQTAGTHTSTPIPRVTRKTTAAPMNKAPVMIKAPFTVE